MDNRAKGEEANKALEEARNEFRKNAKKINLVLDTVDPTGNNTTDFYLIGNILSLYIS